MTITITGIGTAVPEFGVLQTDCYELTNQFCCDTDEQRRVMEIIYERSGVKEKGSVLLKADTGTLDDRGDFFQPRTDPDDRGPTTRARMEKYEAHALELAIESCRNALAQAQQDVSEITHLVTVSCSGFSAPGYDIGLIRELGLSPETSRSHVGFMGCHGAFNALRVAKAYVEADPKAVVLLCSVELCSLHYHYGWSMEKVIANGLFADGSGAVICRAAVPTGTSAKARYQLVRNGSHVLPGTLNAMTWTIGDFGFEMTLSQKVPTLIEKNLSGWMTDFLAREGLTIADVKRWAIHPGGPKILDSCLAALTLPEECVTASREILAEHGNMSSATILFLLERLRKESINGPVVALGFGPGLTIEAMLLRCDE